MKAPEIISTRCMRGWRGLFCVADNLLGCHEDILPWWRGGLICRAHHWAMWSGEYGKPA